MFDLFKTGVWTFLISIFCVNMGFSQGNQNEQSLFDGTDLMQWDEGETPAFEVKYGEIRTTVRNGSNLFTNETYGNFIFDFDYLLSEVGNSGILIRSDPQNAWGTGAEIQLLAPWTPYRDDLHCTASIYDHVAITNRPDETPNVWHHMRIICDRNLIQIYVDDLLTTEARIDTVESLTGMYKEGKIGIQSNHSKEEAFARFKNLTIINLDQNPSYVMKGFLEEDVALRKQAYNAALRFSSNTMVDSLINDLDSKNPYLTKASRQILFDIVAKVTKENRTDEEYDSIRKSFQNAIDNKAVKTRQGRQYLRWINDLL